MELMVEEYKQTEVGLIPVDWEVKKLGSFANISSGGTPSRKVASYWDGLIPWITTSQIDSNLIKEANEFITEDGLNNSAAKIYKAGTILMAMYGQGKTRGKVAILNIDASTNQACAAISLERHVLKEFIFLNLAGRYDEIRSLSNNGNQENLNSDLIKKISIALPPTLTEQTAIATALSDADALISSLEKLIAKKRNIKQGAMQKLLEPKEGFQLRELGEVVKFIGGSQPPLSNFRNTHKEGYIRLLQIRDYKTNKYETFIPIELARKFCNKEDIMIGRYGPPVFQILRGLDGAYNVALMKAVPSKEIDKDYAYHFLKQDSLFNFVDKLSQRSSGQTGVDLQELRTYPIKLPNMTEQIRIATILSDMSDEIIQLETKLEKYRNVKLGMMQNLLTGKIRLV
jgi:type I restriction enzyme S subunit